MTTWATLPSTFTGRLLPFGSPKEYFGGLHFDQVQGLEHDQDTLYLPITPLATAHHAWGKLLLSITPHGYADITELFNKTVTLVKRQEQEHTWWEFTHIVK